MKFFSLLSLEANKKQSWTLVHPSATIKEGYLHKHKADGLHLVSRFTFKKRYFWLNNKSFSYSKSPEWQVSAPSAVAQPLNPALMLRRT